MRRGRVVAIGGLLAAALAIGQPMAVAHASPTVRTGAQAPLSATEARALSSNVTRKVIVLMKDEDTAAPDTASREAVRAQTFAAVQRPVLSELTETHARSVHAYRLLDAVAATVSAGEEARLAANPAVSKVIPDEAVPVADQTTAVTNAAATIGTPVAPLPGACSSPSHPQLNPQADSTVDAINSNPSAKTAASLGYTGAGVKVAFIADGLDVDSPEFVRPNGQHVFVDYQDFSGSGTASVTGGGEAFLDAGSIAAQGAKVYDVSDYSALPLSKPCDIRIEGVAPGASLVGLDVFGDEPAVYSSVFLEAIDYAVTHDHVNVINESFGDNEFPDQSTLDLTSQADEAAVAAGVTVTVSSGDSGITNTIGSPATDPAVISAGASTTYRIDAQDGYGGARFPGVKGWLDDNISSLSSGGETEAGRTVDVVAPGELNWLPCSADVSVYEDCESYAGQPTAFQATGGTSESSPITAGVAALVIQAYREGHGNATPTPAVVKQIITSTATPIDAPGDQEGAGILDAYQAVLAARSYDETGSKVQGATVLTSPSQLDVSAQPGTPENLTESVTNNGTSTQTVTATSRTLGAYTSVADSSVTLSGTTGTHPIDWAGAHDNAQSLTFTVPAGEDRLNASIAFKNASATDLDARVRLTLVDPEGRLAAYSLPQGDGGYGDVQVARPAAGTWTAYIYSRWAIEGGTKGKVVFGAQVANWTSYGTVTPPSLTLAPGATGRFAVATTTPTAPGDQAASLLLRSQVGSAAAGSTSVPIIARSLIPAGPTSFTGMLTGGNGRSPFTGQTAYYQLDVPDGAPALNASITLADNADNPFSAELVNPQGQAVSIGSNETIATSAAGPTGVPSLGAELHVVAPQAGVWDVVIDFLGQVSGTALSEPDTVTVDQTPVPASSSGVPDSTSTDLAAGVADQATVTVTNTGTAPQAYFVDARLSSSASVKLTPLGGPAETAVPGSVGVTYVVPTDTTGLKWTATSTVPLLAELTNYYGDPDLLGDTTGTSAGGSITTDGTPLAQGPWALVPQEVGPDGAKGAPSAVATTSLTATTAAFDPTVTSSTGDLWAESTDPDATVNLIVVQPGQSAQIPVTITPKGADGTEVTGIIHVDDADLAAFGSSFTPDADQVASFPYAYTVGS
jgi:hypothetical protein